MSVSSTSVSETPKSPHLRKAKSPHACLRTNVAYTQVYSRRAVPGLTHYYDLHAYFRYNVYLRKPSAAEQERRRRRHWHAARFNASRGGGAGGAGGAGGTDCRAFRTRSFRQRYTRDGQACVQPFRMRGSVFDDCTALGRDAEWCCLEQDCSSASPSWGYCAPLL